jgi:hypothetical protein
MTEELQLIFELRKKLRGLQDWAKRTNHCELTTERAIATSINVKRSTFKSQIQNDRLSVSIQDAVADAFGFSVSWTEWRDPKIPRLTPSERRCDTATAFLEKFEASKAGAAYLTIQAGPVEKHLDRRFADFFLTVPGSFDPQAQRDGIPLLLGLSFDRRGLPIPLDGTTDVIAVGLKQADIQLFQIEKNANAKIVASEISCGGDSEGNFRGSVEGLSSWWVITVATSDDRWLMGKRLRNDGQDCVCSGLKMGDKIRALMTARIDNCFVEIAPKSFDGKSQDKIRFVKHLHKLAVLNGTEAVLGEQILRVVDKS